ncbi:MAG: hypothetical protein ACE5JB_15245 [bacterium]
MSVLLAEPRKTSKPKLLDPLDIDIISHSHISSIYPTCRDQVRIAI